MTVPLWDESIFPPNDKFSIDLVGASIEGGRALSGITGAMDITGGGLWRVDWGIDIQTDDQHRALNRMAWRLNGSVNTVKVPFLSEELAAFGTGPTAAVVGDTDLNAGTISLSITSSIELSGGEYFSIQHPTRDWRTYGVKEIDSVSGTSTKTYVAAIAPPLREAIPDATAISFSELFCLMRLMPGTTIPRAMSGFKRVQTTVSFIEAF